LKCREREREREREEERKEGRKEGRKKEGKKERKDTRRKVAGLETSLCHAPEDAKRSPRKYAEYARDRLHIEPG
jgi:hypothetical protein